MSNIQYDYSTLSTSISRSELALISQNTVDTVYDINEETESPTSSSSEEVFVPPAPPDKYKFVYLTFGLLGIGTLLPWNFFITANDYWMYKFRSSVNKSCVQIHNKTDLQASFTSFVTLSNNVPYVIFLFLCTIFKHKLSKLSRVFAPLSAMFFLFIIVTSFVVINTDAWQMGFFSLTILIILGVGVVSAILQSGVAGITSLLPSQYMHIMVLGQATAGIVASVAQILSLIGNYDSVKSALFYFISADLVLLATLATYLLSQRTDFYQYHTLHVKNGDTALKDVSELELKAKVSIVSLFKLVWPYAVSILLDFWVTIGIFPGLAVLQVPASTIDNWNGKLYLPLVCFLLFNSSDFCGRLVAKWLPIPHSKRKYLLACCVSRLLFFPLFMLCNVHPRHHLPVIFSSDIYYIAFMTVMGFSNGYFVAVAMVVGTKSVNPILQEITGMLFFAFLGTGLMLGALTSFICIKII